MNPVLSHVQARPLLDARARGDQHAEVSIDLGISRSPATLGPQGVQIPHPNPSPSGGRGVGGEEFIPWEIIAAIAADENGCYIIRGEEASKIQRYSDLTGRAYSLYPTGGTPTMLVGGLPMHRIKDTDPYRDTLEKIRAARPAGAVLDTCTGLGYTAIEASKLAAHVTTVELDPAAIEICRLNPWSQGLFDNPKITQIIGDSFEEIASFSDGAFSRVIHDPPYISLAGDLYSLDFYSEVYRVLSQRGRLFHYIGDPESKSGRSATAGVIRRLEGAGFRRIERAPRAFGVVAAK